MIETKLAERGFTQAEREQLKVGAAVIGKLKDMESWQKLTFTMCNPQDHKCEDTCGYCNRNEGALFAIRLDFRGHTEFICIDCMEGASWYEWTEEV